VLNLTERRIAAGLSKAALARRASLDQALLSKIESGRVRPYERELQRLAAALDVPVLQAATLLEEVRGVPRGMGQGSGPPVAGSTGRGADHTRTTDMAATDDRTGRRG